MFNTSRRYVSYPDEVKDYVPVPHMRGTEIPSQRIDHGIVEKHPRVPLPVVVDLYPVPSEACGNFLGEVQTRGQTETTCWIYLLSSQQSHHHECLDLLNV